MTRRLLISYLGLAVLILLVLEAPLATLAQRFERQLATNQVEKEGAGLVALVNDSLGPAHRSRLSSTVAGYGSRTGGEVVLESVSGAVLASSSTEAHDEVRNEWGGLMARALAGQTVAVFSEDEGDAFAVTAVPIVENGQTVAAVVLAAPAELTERRIHEIWLALGLFALGAIVIAGLAGVVLARSLARPLARLETTVDRFGRGELGLRASEQVGPDEIRSLARQFNHMAGRLDGLIEGQRRFVADASHQLRSPLTALRLRLENLEATADLASQDSIAAVGREVQRLSRLVDGLLTLGRAGHEIVSRADIDVASVLDERCVAWAPLTAEKGVVLECRSSLPDDYRCPLNPGDLEQILDNLLANAVEISPASTTIRMILQSGPAGGAEVHVSDEGPGMSEEDRHRAFDRFWQGSARPSGHSGLGLAIVAELAHRNGLEVSLRPVPSGGLDAVVSLPPSPRPGSRSLHR